MSESSGGAGRPQIAIGHLSHESNSFSPVPTPLAAFDPIARGHDAVLSVLEDYPSLRGFRDGSPAEWTLRGLLAAEAMPSAPVDAAAAGQLCAWIRAELDAAGRVDGVLLYLHGAMLDEDGKSLDLRVCRAVRSVLPPGVPVVVVMDLHGNLSHDLADLVQGVVAYHTNPHIDEHARAVDAAQLLGDLLQTGAPSRVEVVKPALLLPTVHMLTDRDPMARLEAAARAAEREPEVAAVAVFGGWPLADAPWAGPAVAVTATDRATARAHAQSIAAELESSREQFAVTLTPIREALARKRRRPGPLVLADVADNPGGGGTADTTDLLRHLVDAGVPGAIGCIWDPILAQRLHDKRGQRVRVAIGGRSAPQLYGEPVEAEAIVGAVGDGRFRAEGAVLDHAEVDCGPTVRLDVGRLRVVVTSQRHPANDRGFFRHVGVDPEREPLIAVKSRGHFRAEFEPIAAEVIEVDARGPTHPDLRRYAFTRVRRPIWPLDHGSALDREQHM